MARTKWTEDYFRKGLKAERERRGLTQPELAELFKANGLDLHWTTIAKIENGDRSVRIDEVARIADVFETSVDALLGRRVASDDLAHTLRMTEDTARRASDRIGAAMMELRDRQVEVAALDFNGSPRLQIELQGAVNALLEAAQHLRNVAEFQPSPVPIVKAIRTTRGKVRRPPEQTPRRKTRRPTEQK